MQKKLTLRMDEELIARAKMFAKEEGTSLSQFVGTVFASLERDRNGSSDSLDLSPRVRALVGAFKGDADESDYHKYLDEKYG